MAREELTIPVAEHTYDLFLDIEKHPKKGYTLTWRVDLWKRDIPVFAGTPGNELSGKVNAGKYFTNQGSAETFIQNDASKRGLRQIPPNAKPGFYNGCFIINL